MLFRWPRTTGPRTKAARGHVRRTTVPVPLDVGYVAGTTDQRRHVDRFETPPTSVGRSPLPLYPRVGQMNAVHAVTTENRCVRSTADYLHHDFQVVRKRP